ncbi:hypothetical protein R6Q59_012051 [Mikania micrantha]|uniref:Uncharacterized protein n=1 Tax=Mikania micrantha TaxID=192012 RepID=A0A5N6LN33_9ASTR|nr:hypothetical protein E3N88_40627 [Mikania micrantha]
MEPTPVHTLNLKGVFSVSKKIILDRYWHFVTLSLFFLPLCFFLTILPTFDYQKLQISHPIYILIVYILAVCAVGTITYSTHHAFFGSPVKISDSLMSLISSFFRLALTAIIAHVLTVLISLTFFMLVGTLFMLVNRLWFVIDYNSTYFMWCSAIACVILIAIIVHVNVEWSLAFVVVVVESRWGFSALMRSSYLVKGMRSVSLLVMLYFGFFGALLVGSCSTNQHFLLVYVLGLLFVMMCLLRIIAAYTVLYNYCKALHGELVLDVAAEGLVHDYMSLPADDDKVPHIVSVVAA